MDYPNTSESSSPRDIAGSISRAIVDEEVPSRSYYSSHLNIEPGKKKADNFDNNKHELLK